MNVSTQPLHQFLTLNPLVIQTRLDAVRGSAPRDAGTLMYITLTEIWGTVGGGQLEHMIIQAAQKMITTNQPMQTLTIPLGPAIGQCCGGSVDVSLTLMTADEKADAIDQDQSDPPPSIYIFGAGHVGRAIADQMQHLPVTCILIDTREQELAQAKANIEKRLTALPEHDITTAPKHSVFIILTHEHHLDFLLTSAALNRRDAAYVGMIGSASKRARFASWYAQDTHNLTCPIGANDTHDKRPAIIAAFVTAEVMTQLAKTGQTTDTQTIHTLRART